MRACRVGAPGEKLHAHGMWVPDDSSPPYRLSAQALAGIGLYGDQSYAQCDSPTHTATHRRQLFRWEPRDCELRPFDRGELCRLLRHKQIFAAGDSQLAQMFVSLVALLGGDLGRNRPPRSTPVDFTASACNDTVRLAFARNDLLLWTRAPLDVNTELRQCAPLLKLYPWAERAVEADLLIIGTGHHVPQALACNRLVDESAAASARRAAFFTRNLNRSLASVVRERRRRGHRPASTLVLGLSLPVPGCARFHEPLAADEALAVYAEREISANYTMFWKMSHEFNNIAEWHCSVTGAGFLDVALMSLQRPDGAMAAHGPKLWRPMAQQDCLHYCLPGVPDVYSTLLLNHLSTTERHSAPRQ